MEGEAVLYYFDGRGRAEIIRMILCAAKLKFKEVHFTERAQFLKMIEEGELLYNAVPMLKIDGMNLVQTNAILRYIARKAGLDGKDATEKTWVDMYFEGSRDLYMPFLTILFLATVEETKAKAERSFPKFLPVFEKALEKSGTGFLVGTTLTLADLGLMEALLAINDYFGVGKLEPYPHLKAYFEKMCSLDVIDHYIKNVRQKPNDEKYIATVKAVLAFP